MDLYMVPTSEEGSKRLGELARRLGTRGLNEEFAPTPKGFMGHLKQARRLYAAFVLICGDNEIRHGVYALRRLSDGAQVDIPSEMAEQWSSREDLEGAVQ